MVGKKGRLKKKSRKGYYNNEDGKGNRVDLFVVIGHCCYKQIEIILLFQ